MSLMNRLQIRICYRKEYSLDLFDNKNHKIPPSNLGRKKANVSCSSAVCNNLSSTSKASSKNLGLKRQSSKRHKKASDIPKYSFAKNSKKKLNLTGDSLKQSSKFKAFKKTLNTVTTKPFEDEI